MVHHRLSAVNQHLRAGLVGFFDNLCHRVFRPEHVRDLGDRHQPRFIIQQCVELLKLQRPVKVKRNDPQLRANALTEHLPRHDIGVVLHLGDDDVIPRVDLRVAPAVSD